MADTPTVIKRSNIIAGIATVILGIILVAWPGPTLVVLAWVLGIQLIIWGGATIIMSLMMGSGGTIALGLIGGVLSIVIGIASLRYPARTVAFLAIVLGAAWFVSGMFDLFESMRGPGTRWGALVYSVLTILAGVILMSSPITSSSVLAITAGILMIVIGISRIFSAGELAKEFEEVMA